MFDKELEIYTVEQITEADFGCEETGRNEPYALLRLKSFSDNAMPEKYIELPESFIAKQGIEEGKKVCISDAGEVNRYIRVVAAVIIDESDGVKKVFATARGYGAYKGWWEFPGGKIEAGETPREALVREIAEELTARIEAGELLKTIEYDYPEFHLSMDCFLAKVVSGRLELKEAESAKWLTKDTLDSVRWLPADLELIATLKDKL